MLIGIAAVAENGVIGRNNDLIWKLPDDLKRFMKITTGHPVVMGRRTFESLPGPLPKRQNIVVTTNSDWQAEGVIVYNDLETALREALKLGQKVFVMGGGKVYEQAMPFLNRLDITLVHHEFEGDTFFPKIDKNIWQETSREFHPTDERHAYAFSFLGFERIDRPKSL